MVTCRFAFILIAAGVAGCAGSGRRDIITAALDMGLPTYRCRLAGGQIEIDGLLDDAPWQNAPFSADFIRRRYGVRQMPPGIRTRMKMLHDSHNLYIAIQCFDSDIWSTFTDRDDPVVFEEAAVVYVDPLGNGRDYYGIAVNPLNALLDLKRPDGSLDMSRRAWLECTRWNAEGIEHAVSVDGTVNERSDRDTAWTVEIKLPFDALGVRPLPGDAWRIQIGRNTRPRLSGIVVSSWTDAVTLYSPNDFGVLVFQE
jgi:hypothetical protein